MVQYYTLEEAASKLRLTPDALKELAKNGGIRAFQDRGTWRFRAQEVEEAARLRGISSDPDLQLGDAEAALKEVTRKPGNEPSVFEFTLGSDDSDEVSLGQDLSPGTADRGTKKGGSKLGVPPGSDSDVRLVSDGSGMEFQVDPERSSRQTPSSRKTSRSEEQDSGVRMVPMDKASDSDAKIVPDMTEMTIVPQNPRASDPSAEAGRGGKGEKSRERKESVITEEIDLDAESRAAAQKMDKSGESRIGKSASDGGRAKNAKEKLSSSEFELTASPRDGHDEEVDLGRTPGGVAGDSGIDLKSPADSGISLEGSSIDELDFELKGDVSSASRPSSVSGVGLSSVKDPSSEFELSIDDSSGAVPTGDSSSDSEFELSLDVDDGSSVKVEGPQSDSDSEFELTVDDGEGAEQQKDIFETDFEVPALDDGSGSEAVALEEDSELESSSDFDIEVNEEDSSEDDTGSHVVALDEGDEADEGAETVARPRRAVATRGTKKGRGAQEELEPLLEDELEGDLADEDSFETRPASAVAAPPAEWGVVPIIGLIPTVLVLSLVALMTFELVQGLWGYHKGTGVKGAVTNSIASLFGVEVPKE